MENKRPAGFGRGSCYTSLRIDHGIDKYRELGHQHRVNPLFHRSKHTGYVHEPELVGHEMDELADVGRGEVDEQGADRIVDDTDLIPGKTRRPGGIKREFQIYWI